MVKTETWIRDKAIRNSVISALIVGFLGWAYMLAFNVYTHAELPSQKVQNIGIKALVQKDSIRSIQDIRTQAKIEIVISGQVNSEKKIDKLQESIERTNELIISVLWDRNAYTIK